MNRMNRFLMVICYLILATGFLSCENSNSVIQTVEVTYFPPYVDIEKVNTIFGRIYLEVDFSLTSITEFPKIINSIKVYSEKKGVEYPLAVISKTGFLRNGSENISPNGFEPTSDFIKKFFIGFSSDSIDNPFILYGIAKDLQGNYYETDPLIIWDFDYDNQTTKLFMPVL